jgi:hypothetical protein
MVEKITHKERMYITCIQTVEIKRLVSTRNQPCQNILAEHQTDIQHVHS